MVWSIERGCHAVTDFHDGAPDAKPTRAKPRQIEHGLSHWVDVFLDRCLTGYGWYTAIEGGTWWKGQTDAQRMHAENKRRLRGIKPAHLDWYVYQTRTGLFAQIELKVDGRETRKGQEQTMLALFHNGITAGKCETVPEVYALLNKAGFELHGNAENIASELHERYLAGRRTVPKKTKRAPKSAPRHPASAGFVNRAAKRGISLG
jgi:hypothetical protein